MTDEDGGADQNAWVLIPTESLDEDSINGPMAGCGESSAMTPFE
jgi:hypothetical protein